MASHVFLFLNKDSYFFSLDKFQEEFEEMKEKLSNAPIHRVPNCTFPFHTHIESSDKAIGATFGQVDGKLPYAIYFINKNLSKD